MALPSEEERALIEKLRERLADVLSEENEANDDMFFVRWLRARDLDLDAAENMLRNAIKWRKGITEASDIPKPTQQYYLDNFPCWQEGHDKENRPVFVAPIGAWSIEKIGSDEKAIKLFEAYLTNGFETMLTAIKESGRLHGPPVEGEPPVSQVTVIYDFKGFAWWKQIRNYQTIQNWLQLGSLYEAYYPEILYRGYFTNCPSVISTLLNLLTPVLAPKTMRKIKCFGSNKDVWDKELMDLLPENGISYNSYSNSVLKFW